MFGLGPQKVEVDGVQLPIAPVLRRGAAIAIDLCLAVGAGALGFYLVSLAAPLDSKSAKTPILVVVGLIAFWVAWGRNHSRSPGREIFRLRLVRVQGLSPRLFSRAITVHRDEHPVENPAEAGRAFAVVTLASVLTVLCLAAGLGSTNAFRTVLDYTERFQPLVAEKGAAPRLASFPRALLLGTRRGYVQAGANWGEKEGLLEFFLAREGRRWNVVAVRETAASLSMNYSLAVPDREIPPPPE